MYAILDTITKEILGFEDKPPQQSERIVRVHFPDLMKEFISGKGLSALSLNELLNQKYQILLETYSDETFENIVGEDFIEEGSVIRASGYNCTRAFSEVRLFPAGMRGECALEDGYLNFHVSFPKAVTSFKVLFHTSSEFFEEDTGAFEVSKDGESWKEIIFPSTMKTTKSSSYELKFSNKYGVPLDFHWIAVLY